MKRDTLKPTIRYHAVRRGKVTLSSGKESDLYFDLRAIYEPGGTWRFTTEFYVEDTKDQTQ